MAFSLFSGHALANTPHDQFRKELAALIDLAHGSGAGYAVFSGGEGFAGGVGVARRSAGPREYDRGVDAETVFSVASVSKLVTALACHLAIEEGLFSLDDDVRTLSGNLFESSFNEPVLVRHLLDHTSGMKEVVAAAPEQIQGYYPPVRELFSYLPRVPNVWTKPGFVPTYSNVNYVLLMHLIERAAGVPFDDYIQKRILRPLGMNRTSFRSAAFTDDNTAYGYRFRGIVDRRPLFERVLPLEGFYRPAAGMLSSASDLLRLVRVLVRGGVDDAGEQVLSATAVRALQSIDGSFARAAGMRTGHASGLVVREREGLLLFGHNGITDGFMAALFYSPERDFGVAILYNSHALPEAPSLSSAVGLAIRKFANERTRKSNRSNLKPDAPVNEYEGIWFLENPRFEILRFQPWLDPLGGYIVLQVENGRLFRRQFMGNVRALLPAEGASWRYEYERFGHMGIQKINGTLLALDAPNRLYRRLELSEFVFLHAPPLLALFVLGLGAALFLPDLLWQAWSWQRNSTQPWQFLSHYSPQLVFLSLLLPLPFMSDSVSATSLNVATVSFFVASLAGLPVVLLALTYIARERRRFKGPRFFAAVINVSAGILCLGVMAWHGFYAVLLGRI